LGYKACAAGIKEQEASNLLEKAFKKAGETGEAVDAVKVAITTFQSLLSADFKADEIEIAVAARNSRFRVLSTAEVEAQLVAIAERD
jgi:20S proteasome subunit alpha 1